MSTNGMGATEAALDESPSQRSGDASSGRDYIKVASNVMPVA